MNRQLRACQKLFAQHFNLRGLGAFLPACRARLPTGTRKPQRGFFRIGYQALSIHRVAILAPEISKLAALFRAGTDLRHRHIFEYRLQCVE